LSRRASGKLAEFTPANPLQVTISIGGQDVANMFRSFYHGQHVLGVNSFDLTSFGARTVMRTLREIRRTMLWIAGVRFSLRAMQPRIWV
jgi:hypothetical protein